MIVKDIVKLQADLGNIPAKPKEEREIEKAAALKMLTTQFITLRAKGYQFGEIAKLASDNGFPINERKVKSLLSKSKKQKRKTEGTHKEPVPEQISTTVKKSKPSFDPLKSDTKNL